MSSDTFFCRISHVRYTLMLLCSWSVCFLCCSRSGGTNNGNQNLSVKIHADSLSTDSTSLHHPTPFAVIEVPRDIIVRNYFSYLDSIVSAYDSIAGYELTEYILVHANSWIIDTLVSFDYYKKKEAGIFVYDQKELVVIHQGDSIIIPGKDMAAVIKSHLDSTYIDVNIPEYKLRIVEGDSIKYTFPVRVGQNRERYLKTAGRSVSLRTPIGKGEIIRIAKDPWYMNPVNGHRYFVTNRDDGKQTRLPMIPFLEPTIDGRRQGSLIHPTTNPITLGKAFSNGCVGTEEGNAWIVYYNAPPGTGVVFRYDLRIVDQGDTLELKDIYHLKKESRPKS